MEHKEEEPDLDEAEREEDEIAHPTAPLHLIGIVQGSAAYKVAARDSERALQTLREMGRCLQEPDGAQWGPEILSPVEELSNVARSLGCSIEFKHPGTRGAVLATITPLSYDSLSETAFVRGESSVYGYLERVGGAVKRHCGLRLPNQPTKMVICPVQTEELIRQLGQHVYQNVLVSGTVTWFRRTGRVKSIIVKSFEPSKHGSILQTLRHIHEVGGKAWDEVGDPEGLIKEMRGA
ncbi:MAG: hypothetical protein WBF17_14185 [Phycisphaerae bacterium]